MATGEQIKSLVKAHIEQNNDRFETVVLQIAAHEAKLGHDKLARELKNLLDKANIKRPNIIQLNNQNPMFDLVMPSQTLSELIVNDDIFNRIQRIISEYRNKKKLKNYGLTNRRKILIEGRPGTGKTLTASIIASELSFPLYIVQMDKLVTKYMGETSVKLRQVFESIDSNPGVYLFDEFDAIGADRNLDNEVGEMRRILNTFLQFLEQDESESIIIAATNNPQMLDQALFRRFDDVLHYDLPDKKYIEILFENKIISFDNSFKLSIKLINAASGLNHAEITRICEDAIKISILTEEKISEPLLLQLIKERKNIYQRKEV